MDYADLAHVNEPLKVEVSGDVATVIVSDDMAVSCCVPIPIEKSVKEVVIKPDRPVLRNLVLMPTEGMQPCIGPTTSTNLSFGRFSLSGAEYNKLIIDNVNVICLPNEANPDFALGTYGKQYVPEIQLLRDGSIQCPETTGTRIMINNIQHYAGSTKLTGEAVYKCVKPGEDMRYYMTDVQKEYTAKIYDKNPDIANMLTPMVSELAMKSILDVMQFTDIRDINAWISPNNPNSGTFYMLMRTCELTGMEYFYARRAEFLFEVKKADFIQETYFGKYKELPESEAETMDIPKASSIVMRYIIDSMAWKEHAYEIAYELIPTYFWTFTKKPHKEEVDLFLEQYPADVLRNDEMLSLITHEGLKKYWNQR